MDKMAAVVSKIKRLRTFSDDVANARGSLAVPEKKVEPVIATKPVVPRTQPTITMIPPGDAAKYEIKTLKPVAPVVKKIEPTIKPLPTQPKIIAVAPLPPPVKAIPKPVAVAAPTIAPKNLQEEVSAISEPQKSSILATPVDGLDVSSKNTNVEMGSIVSDHKKERFNIFSAAWASLNEWFTGKVKDFETSKSSNTVKVRPIESRADVLQKAASQSALAPKNDRVVVPVKTPATEAAKVAAASSPIITIKKAEAVPLSNWSHFKGQPRPF